MLLLRSGSARAILPRPRLTSPTRPGPNAHGTRNGIHCAVSGMRPTVSGDCRELEVARTDFAAARPDRSGRRTILTTENCQIPGIVPRESGGKRSFQRNCLWWQADFRPGVGAFRLVPDKRGDKTMSETWLGVQT